MSWRSTLLAVLALTLVMADDSLAQRGDDRSRSDRSRSDRDRGDSRDRGSDRSRWERYRSGSDRDSRSRGSSTSAMLQSLDRNKNGQLDPSEMQGTAGRFVEPMLRNAGINTGRAISIRELERLAGGSRSSGSSRDRDRDDDDAPLVLGFGNDFEDSIVPGFGPMDADMAVALAEEYDERTIRRVDYFLDRADANHNGVLDRSEWEGLGGRYDTSEADKNRDGRITRLELAAQMEAEAERDDERRESWRRGDRGSSDRGDRGDGDRGESRSSWGRGGDRESSGRWGRGRGGYESFEGSKGEWTRDERGNWVRVENDDDDRGRGRDGDGEDGDEFQSSDHDKRSSYSLSGSNVERGTPSEFGQMDSNGDGQISMNEYLALDPQSLNARAADFERMDTNGDGILGSREYNVGTGGRPSGGSSSFGGSGRPFGRDRGERGGDNDNEERRNGEERRDSGNRPVTPSRSFGRGPEKASSSSNSSQGSASSASSDQYMKFATGFISRYDENNNSILDPNEFPNTKMVDLKAADTDGDGKVTAEEIAAQMNPN